MICHPEVPFFFRRKGLPKRMKRLPGGVPGMRAACSINFGDGPAAKVVFFKDRRSMSDFYRTILPRYRGAEGLKIKPLGRRCMGFVNDLCVGYTDNDTGKLAAIETDRRYFCIVCLVEGDLTAEVLAHEAVHVGFAWDRRTKGISAFTDRHNPEENVCYPSGIFLDQVLTFIKREGLREV